ncbi:hypothetical protein YC2023_045509 [Brassica napus]
MANPHEPHFFKPLLPGFHSGTIPLAFFSKHIEGKTNQKTWKLRSDASYQTWEVIQEGRTLTGGWKDYTTAHDLQIGDLVIFKHEGDMEEADAGDADDNEISKSQSKFIVLVLPVVRCFDVETCFFYFRRNRGNYLPKRATSFTALKKQCQKMILVNKEGNSWTASLRFSESGGIYYITRDWEKFCR